MRLTDEQIDKRLAEDIARKEKIQKLTLEINVMKEKKALKKLEFHHAELKAEEEKERESMIGIDKDSIINQADFMSKDKSSTMKNIMIAFNGKYKQSCIKKVLLEAGFFQKRSYSIRYYIKTT